MRPFFDTNVLVYAVLSDDPRCATAVRVLTAGGAVSIQVLNEFVNVARNKLKWPWGDIEATLGWFSADRDTISRCQPTKPPSRLPETTTLLSTMR